MPPRNSKTPVSGQRSISTFFATKPKLQSVRNRLLALPSLLCTYGGL
jgi:hypothetical protein